MVDTITSLHHPDHFFSAPAAQPDRWRALNDKHKPGPLAPAGHGNCGHVRESTVTQPSGDQA
jgi:hypothetical protein